MSFLCSQILLFTASQSLVYSSVFCLKYSITFVLPWNFLSGISSPVSISVSVNQAPPLCIKPSSTAVSIVSVNSSIPVRYLSV